MEYKNHIFNSSVILDSKGSCEINYAGCSFGKKERKEDNKLNISDLKERIDFASVKLDPAQSLIFHPGNVLLNYSIKEVEEIFLYASSKTKIIQWELEKFDEKILNILDSGIIKNLIKENKLFLNIPFEEGNINLLHNIYNKISDIGVDRIRKKLSDKGELDSFRKLDDNKKFSKLCSFREEGIIDGSENSINLSFHLSGKNSELEGVSDFLDYLGFDSDEFIFDCKKGNNYGKNYYFDSIQHGIVIILHFISDNKIDKNGNKIWKSGDEDFEKKGKEYCNLLSLDFEWSIGGDKDGTILPHLNPCINKISFGNLKSSEEEIQKLYDQHRLRIGKILIKNQYSKNFDQSKLCNMCLNGENPDIKKIDILKYDIRKKFFRLKNFFI